MPEFSWTPEPASGISQAFVAANGQRFEVAECGAGERLALCLHGFPELNYSWRFQMPMLAARGWRVWAPNLRGYGASSRPEGVAAYAMDMLVADVAALIDASGAREVLLVAHDWGALIAWQFAIQRVRPLVGLVIMNVPHPFVARREIRHWRQLRRSWYVFFFQLPKLPELMMTRDGARGVRQAFVGMAVDKARFPEEVLNIYAAAALRPRAMTAMVNYYRALLRFPPDAGDGRVEVPTLMLWGEEDAALNIRCTEGTEQWVADFTLRRLPGVSHWVQQEAPEAVNAHLAEWLDGLAVAR
ncbi:alpha/beta fold hydrolase [Sandaracinobacteroides saxicola]|uniref:Alpha/beta fold hydrolase n=1 Tax=Sandaracinobacteroides saxicola TaxID=2759707 RepID=A0A7G5IH14_9SPHN|nr:alpha/beta fold hydrolase [Sandaracinobacteroides saxicola]QMW22656.1 alpha/beta fold hydrolase [Sandaracinobacteroides saxicola]